MMQSERLSSLNIGESAVVESLSNEPSMKRRLMDLGFVPGSKVSCVAESPLGDPKAFLIKNTVIALRQETGEQVCVKPVSDR